MTTLSNYELQRAINETAKASTLASFSIVITLDQHLQRLTAIQLERARGLPETQEPPLEFSRGQCLPSDVANAHALLRQCGFKKVSVRADDVACIN